MKITTQSSGTRLGTRFRGKLAAAYGQRGVATNSLWYVFSPRMRSDWVLKSDLEWDHFILSEADPLIVACDYTPGQGSLVLKGVDLALPVTAVVTYGNGQIVYRHVRFEHRDRDNQREQMEIESSIKIAASAGMSYQVWTDIKIRSNPTLLANWRRVIAWMSAVRDRSMKSLQEEIDSAFSSHPAFTLGEIEALFGEPAFPLYAASIFYSIQCGVYNSDLALVPLSLNTVITKGELP